MPFYAPWTRNWFSLNMHTLLENVKVCAQFSSKLANYLKVMLHHTFIYSFGTLSIISIVMPKLSSLARLYTVLIYTGHVKEPGWSCVVGAPVSCTMCHILELTICIPRRRMGMSEYAVKQTQKPQPQPLIRGYYLVAVAACNCAIIIRRCA